MPGRMSRAGRGRALQQLQLQHLESALVVVLELQLSNRHRNRTPALGSLTRSFLLFSFPPEKILLKEKKNKRQVCRDDQADTI